MESISTGKGPLPGPVSPPRPSTPEVDAAAPPPRPSTPDHHTMSVTSPTADTAASTPTDGLLPSSAAPVVPPFEGKWITSPRLVTPRTVEDYTTVTMYEWAVALNLLDKACICGDRCPQLVMADHYEQHWKEMMQPIVDARKRMAGSISGLGSMLPPEDEA